MIITDGNLDAVDDGIEFVIKRDRSILDKYVLRCSLALSRHLLHDHKYG